MYTYIIQACFPNGARGFPHTYSNPALTVSQIPIYTPGLLGLELFAKFTNKLVDISISIPPPLKNRVFCRDKNAQFLNVCIQINVWCMTKCHHTVPGIHPQ